MAVRHLYLIEGKLKLCITFCFAWTLNLLEVALKHCALELVWLQNARLKPISFLRGIGGKIVHQLDAHDRVAWEHKRIIRAAVSGRLVTLIDRRLVTLIDWILNRRVFSPALQLRRNC